MEGCGALFTISLHGTSTRIPLGPILRPKSAAEHIRGYAALWKGVDIGYSRGETRARPAMIAPTSFKATVTRIRET
jgi:hypothetical protein